MDGFTGFKTAAAEALPDAVEVMDPFHVVQLAGDALDRTRQRVQQQTLGHRGHAGDPLYGVRRALHTGEAFLTDRQRARIGAVFVIDEHVEVEATWGVYQSIVAAYRDPDRVAGRRALQAVIDTLRYGIPEPLSELRKLGRTLNRRAGDVLAYFDPPRHQQRSDRGDQRTPFCLSFTVAFNEAQQVLYSVGFGVGPKLSVDVGAGGSSGATAGGGVGGGCGAAYVVGLYAERELSFQGYELDPYKPIPASTSYGGGIAFGAGAGCAGELVYTWQ